MNKIPAPLFWLWVAITVPVIVCFAVLTYQANTLHTKRPIVIYKNIVITPTGIPSATTSATPALQSATKSALPVVTVKEGIR